MNVTQIVVVGGKLESNGILDEENIDDDLKVFYIQSKKVYRTKTEIRLIKKNNFFFL